MVSLETFMDMFHVFCFGLVTGFVIVGIMFCLIINGNLSAKILPGSPDYKPGKELKDV